MFLSVNTFSQIKDLQDLLNVSRLSENGLNESLYNDWEIEMPYQKQSKDGKSVIVRHLYNNSKKGQAIERVITISTMYNFKMSRTNFYCNDWELLKKVKKEMTEYGYKPKKSLASYYSFYSNGTNSIAIIDKPTKEEPYLKAGSYMISISSN